MDNTIISVLPSIITASVSALAIIVSYKSSKRSLAMSQDNNIDNMRFSQKDKVADQIAEKSAMLLSKCNPNTLNTLINDIVPNRITHEENRIIRNRLLGVSDEIQTLCNVIKMLTYSIFDTEEMLTRFENMSNKLDEVESLCSNMLLELTHIHSSMTPEGEIRNINIMEELRSLERSFSEDIRDPYIELTAVLSDMIWYIRKEAIPKERDQMIKKKQRKR